MGNRGRSLRLESDFSGNNAVPSSISSTTLSASALMNQGNKHVRQFSTRSRAKSSASFKGLTKGMNHDVTFDLDTGANVKSGSFKKCKSSDVLYKRRTFSGLNMTSITGNKANFNLDDKGKPAANEVASNINSGVGLKPRRSKGTHSVLELHDVDEIYSNELTTDEEVEYFTEEDDEQQHQQKKQPPPNKNLPSQQSGLHSERFPNAEMKRIHPIIESKLFKDAEQNDQLKRVTSDKTITNQLSYKVPSNLIKVTKDNIDLKAFQPATTDSDSDEYSLMNNSNDKSISIDDDDRDDHIGNLSSSNDIIETGAHSLKRQGKFFNEADTSLNLKDKKDIVNDKPTILMDNESYIKPGAGHTDQYIPDMILSQSMGMERPFDNHEESPNTQQVETNMINANKHFIQPDNQMGISDTIIEGKVLQNSNTEKFNNDNNIDVGNILDNQGTSFSNSISSLTNNLQKVLPEINTDTIRSNYSPSKFLSQGAASTNRHHGSSNNKFQLQSTMDVSNSIQSKSNLNNFSQFLKSDDIDGDSRTQRKLWLQRESSIMDLSLQSDTASAIFMASNVDVKREFERISHEYTTLRRFYNPLSEALKRVSTDKKYTNKNGVSTSLDTGLGDLRFEGYSDRNEKINGVIPSSEYKKLNRILSNIWKEETVNFSKDANPLSKNKLTTSDHHVINSQPTRHSLRGVMGSNTAIYHQRSINSLQPTTRAVHRRLESGRLENTANKQQH